MGTDTGAGAGAGAGVCAGAVARAGEEQLTGCTAAKQTVDHVWRRLPVNARDNLAIGAGGDVDAQEEIRFILSQALKIYVGKYKIIFIQNSNRNRLVSQIS